MGVGSYHHGDLKNALIEAGVRILAQEGLGGLSLRSVAKQAGVSHSAPYAHFPDKPALVAAICTVGYRRLQRRLLAAVTAWPDQPREQLVAAAVAYARFARRQTAIFKLMFSSSLEKERDYPELVDSTQQVLDLVLQVVAECQVQGLLVSPNPDLVPTAIWGQVHGIVLLGLERQISSGLLQRYSIEQIVEQSMRHWLEE